MTMTRTKLVVRAAAVLVAATTIAGAGIHHLSKSQASFRSSPKELVDEVWQIIDRTYVDGTFNQQDWRAIRKEYLNRDYATPDAAYEAIRKMLSALNDPYTRFMDPTEFKNMQIDTSGELTGVGIQLSQDEETKQLIVVSPIEDSPAFAAGILAKDVIIKIDDKSTAGMDVNDAVNLIRGPVGTQVRITVRRDSADKPVEKTFVISRARIEIHPVRFSLREEGPERVGYIRLNQFSSNATAEMRDAIKKLEADGVSGYILDLRSNPGGLLRGSVEIAQMWLNEGAIVSTVDRYGETNRESASRRALTDKPVVVLINEGSASASEILSGALQDNKRAVIVGMKSFGKGLVQSVRPLGDGSGLAVTIAKYFTPNGRDINKHGIDPDEVVELTEAQIEELSKNRDQIGTLADPQYAKALAVLQRQIQEAKLGETKTGAAIP